MKFRFKSTAYSVQSSQLNIEKGFDLEGNKINECMKEVGIEYVLKRSSLLPVLENLWTLNYGKSPIP